MKLILYYMPGSRSQRVRWMLEELELDYELQHIDLFKGECNTPEYLALHPLGQLPVIVIDGAPMFESAAILQWLADTHLEKGFSPALDAVQRREFNQWMYFAVTNLESHAWDIVLHGKILPEDVSVKSIIPFATNNLVSVLTVIDKKLDDIDYLVDNKFSAVDIIIGHILSWLPEHTENFQNLNRYTQNLQQRPAYIRSHKN